METSTPFYITFWVAIIILAIFSVMYTTFSYEKIGEVQDIKDRVSLLEVRDYLVWSAILLGIAIVFTFLVLAFIIIYGFNEFYEVPGGVFILYIGFLVWFLATLALLIVSYNKLGGGRDILQLTDVQIAKRDIFLVIGAVSTISALLTLGYFGYVYRIDNYYCL